MRQVFIIFALLFTFNLMAQQQAGNWCGSFKAQEESALQKERLLNNLRAADIGFVQQRDIVYVPIDFCLVAESDGSNRVSEGKVLDQLCQLNEDYAALEMQFFLKDGTFSYFNHTGLFENHFAYQNSIMQQQRNSRAINIFVVKTVDDNDGGGITLAYYHTVRDWIVTRKASVGANKIDISHEVGHFFSLHHTFNGWEQESYSTTNVPAPLMSSGDASGTPLPTEWQNGENCNNAGDYICDTPADYGFNNPCNFNVNILDPNGEQVHPDEHNFMGYFLNCGPFHFSDMQQATMQADYNTNGRNYLRIDGHPAIVEINGQSNHITPLNDVTTTYYNHVNLEWSAVDGAEHYFVEVSRVASFTVDPIRVVTTGTNLLLEDLDENKKYYWRIRPFNAHTTCTPASSATSFRTSTTDFTIAATDMPGFINNFNVTPNPVASHQRLNIVLESNKTFKGAIKMVDITGRIVKNMPNDTFLQGENRFAVEISSLANGLYLLQLQTDEGQITRKIIIAN